MPEPTKISAQICAHHEAIVRDAIGWARDTAAAERDGAENASSLMARSVGHEVARKYEVLANIAQRWLDANPRPLVLGAPGETLAFTNGILTGISGEADATPRQQRRRLLFERISLELDRAYAKHGELPWGRHEFYGILKEEVDELWDAIKQDAPQADVHDELEQVAAMCFRYFETGDRYRGVQPEAADA